MSEGDSSDDRPPTRPPKPIPVPRKSSSTTNATDSNSKEQSSLPQSSSQEQRNVANQSPLLTLSKEKEVSVSPIVSGIISKKGKCTTSGTTKHKFLSPEHWATQAREVPQSYSHVQTDQPPGEKSMGSDKIQEFRDRRACSDAERNIYHNTHFGEEWTYATVFLHLLQFSFLFAIGFKALPISSFIIQLVIVIAIPIFLLVSRYKTNKHPESIDWSYLAIKSPQQETDGIPDIAIYMLSLAALSQGAAYALFSISSTGSNEMEATGFSSYETLTQVLGFSAIINYGYHSILRSSNRLDPMRSILEVEIIGICWDALDGTTLYQLLVTTSGMSSSMDTAVRTLMFFWYLSVGFRLTLMNCSHLTPDSTIYRMILPPAKSWSDEPTVDRTLAGLNFKSTLTLLMSASQFFAAGLRLTLLLRGKLDTAQQEMLIKNFLFLIPAGSAILKIKQIQGRYWNTRKLLQVKIPYINIFLNLRKPGRTFQLEVLRYAFCLTYICVGTMLSVFLTQVTSQKLWLLNVATDIICIILFLRLCRQVHSSDAWIIFPKEVAFGLSIVLVLNLYVARLIGLYSNVGLMNDDVEDTWNYTNAMLLVLVSIIPISTYALFWSVSNMLFHCEFTACPESYNAVHDPGITAISVQTMTEGALDIISCAALLSLATEPNLPPAVDGFIVIFAFLEIVNSCQCFVLQVMLSGGHDDTPAHLVLLRSRLRQGRGIIDLGTFVLRLVLWLHYDAVASVFMIKNLFNLLHTLALVERSRGVESYSFDTLFVSYVNPRDWYGMSKEQWRVATRESIGRQARAGIAV